MIMVMELYVISIFFSLIILIDLLVLIRYDKYTGEKVELLNKSYDEDKNVNEQSEKNVNIKFSIILIFVYSFIPLLNLLMTLILIRIILCDKEAIVKIFN